MEDIKKKTPNVKSDKEKKLTERVKSLTEQIKSLNEQVEFYKQNYANANKELEELRSTMVNNTDYEALSKSIEELNKQNKKIIEDNKALVIYANSRSEDLEKGLKIFDKYLKVNEESTELVRITLDLFTKNVNNK